MRQNRCHAFGAHRSGFARGAALVCGYHLIMVKPITDPFVLHVCELLSCAGPCVAKRMFGGWGISIEGMNFALIIEDTLYLKSNTDTEPRWLAAGGHPFIYTAQAKPVKVQYHTPPDEALESPGLMVPWARLALDAAVAARKPKLRKRAKPKAPL
jgi:DNA transformation protein